MTPKRWFAASILVGLFMLAAGSSEAQVLTGSLFGTVKDESGGVLAGRVDSGQLAGADWRTGDRGDQRQGTVSIPHARARRVHTGDRARRLRQVPRRRGFRSTCKATSNGPSSSSSRASRSRSRWKAVRPSTPNGAASPAASGCRSSQSIPVRRFSMFDFIKAAPGVSPTSASSGTDTGVSVFGSGVNENLYLLDGTNFTCPCSGGPAPQPDVDVIQEVHVDSLGAAAEFGNIQGAVFNVVTKQGEQRLRAGLLVLRADQRLTSQPVRVAVRSLQRAADRVHARAIPRPHHASRRPARAGSGLVLRRLSISARLGQPAGHRSAVSARQRVRQGVWEGDLADHAAAEVDEQPPRRVLGQPSAARRSRSRSRRQSVRAERVQRRRSAS